jgi:hypothetical protein
VYVENFQKNRVSVKKVHFKYNIYYNTLRKLLKKIKNNKLNMKIWQYESNDDDKLSQQVKKDPTITYTTEDMAKYLISLIEFKDNDIVMEPCYGDGAFFKNLPTNTKNNFCEINLGIDYLKSELIVDITLSNPPFVPRKLFWEFHQTAMKNTKREIWWLINIGSLNVFTPKRLSEMEELGWYLEHMNIVSDKRWFGRYVWCKFTKNKNNFIGYNRMTF